ncbi:MAG: membrane protease YdiL (CAAX protease family) [Bacteroidia bacterium]|jgi:membrane protease YdiL (CAAX protease family)
MAITKPQLILEMFILFIVMPLVLLVDIHPGIKASVILLAVVYAVRIVVKLKLVNRQELYALPRDKYWKNIFMRFGLLIVLTTTFMLLFHPDDLFIVGRRNLGMLIGISLFYSLFSVYPQEFLYRSFFFERYKGLFSNTRFTILVNAVLFAFAHIAFKNVLVLAMTFVGGLVFSMTFLKTKSLLLTSIEHALYGCWLFTVGMGEMLAFPIPE